MTRRSGANHRLTHSARTDLPEVGQCSVCDLPMWIVEPQQTTHPSCTPPGPDDPEIWATAITTAHQHLGATVVEVTDRGGPCRNRSHSPRLCASGWTCPDCATERTER